MRPLILISSRILMKLRGKRLEIIFDFSVPLVQSSLIEADRE